MNSKRKIWLGVGAFVVAGTGAVAAGAPSAVPAPSLGPVASPGRAADTASMLKSSTAGFVVAQHTDHSMDAGEAGESKGLEALPPDLAFATRLALLRGHLLVGDQLVQQQQWNAALPHFLHPTEEIYGGIKDQLAEYKTPPFDGALNALADVVKARKGGNDYARALKPVQDALVAADAGLKQKQADDWAGFLTEAAVESIKAAAEEYGNAIVGGRLAKPVEYQDARGFILEADRMIESVSADLQKKDPEALKELRAQLAELKAVFPTPIPPRTPVKDHAAVLAIVARIELAASGLM